MSTTPVPTSFPIPPDIEGFWVWAKGRLPRPAMPLTQEVLYRAMTEGFSGAMDEWACPFGAQCRAINYYGFVTLVPFPLRSGTMEDRMARYKQTLDQVLPRMGELWAQEWLPAMLPGLDRARATDYAALSNAELWRTLDEMLQDFLERWTIHGYINFVTISASWFADFYNETFAPADPTEPYLLPRASAHVPLTPAVACGGSAAASYRAPHYTGCSRRGSRQNSSWSWSTRTRDVPSCERYGLTSTSLAGAVMPLSWQTQPGGKTPPSR